jgi:5'(3')-deoxyribonucleotidase
MLNAIYLDLDGVLVDFLGGLAKVAGVDADRMRASTHWWAVNDIISESWGRPFEEEDFLALLEKGGHDMWANLEKFPWCDELYQMCKSYAPTVIMTKPGAHPSSASGKMEWIQKNLPDVERFAITPCKHHMSHPGAILIDDNPVGCEKFAQHGGSVYCFPQPWNTEDWESRDRLAEIREHLELLKRG